MSDQPNMIEDSLAILKPACLKSHTRFFKHGKKRASSKNVGTPTYDEHNRNRDNTGRATFILTLTPPPSCRRLARSSSGTRSAPEYRRRLRAPAASARRSGAASFDKFDAARIPVPPHHMAVLFRFETIE